MGQIRDLLRRCRQTATAVLAVLDGSKGEWSRIVFTDEYSPEAVVSRYFDLYRNWNKAAMALLGHLPSSSRTFKEWDAILRRRLLEDLIEIEKSQRDSGSSNDSDYASPWSDFDDDEDEIVEAKGDRRSNQRQVRFAYQVKVRCFSKFVPPAAVSDENELQATTLSDDPGEQACLDDVLGFSQQSNR